MNLEINLHQTTLGILLLSNSGVEVVERADSRIDDVAALLRGSVTALRHVEEAGGARTTVEQVVAPGDPLWALVARDFLRRKGFGVRQHHPEIEKRIRGLAQRILDAEKRETFLREALGLSHAEQTYLLEAAEEGLQTTCDDLDTADDHAAQ